MRLDEIKDPKLRRRVEDALKGVTTLKTAMAQKFDSDRRTLADKYAIGKPKNKRIRQRTKPKLNQTERDALSWLQGQLPHLQFEAHAIQLELANGCMYSPDIAGKGPLDEALRIYEVKGKMAWDDAIVKLKVAARSWPMLRFWLVWRDKRADPWKMQAVLP